ncbi:MAG: SHOCT domain-containing protein [Anaerolineae bacterium]|nr:SHOCT domain-containing protein [Anaerolineae bacterium]
MRRMQRKRRRTRRRRLLLVGGLVAFGAYKLSKKDAKRVEEHTGVPPEEMTDEEMEKAMDDLGIEKQKVSEADQEDTGGQAAPAEEAPDYLDEIERLGKLKDQGFISEEEFETKKKQLLGL